MKGLFAAARKRTSVRISIVVMLMIGLAAGLMTALAAPLNIAIKHTPASYLVHSAPSLPPEAQALEQGTVDFLFDRDTTTEHVIFDASQVEISLAPGKEVQALKVYGAAPYLLTVQADVGGTFYPVPGLESLDLTALPEGWQIIPMPAPVSTTRIRLDLTPVPGATATGLREVEVWVTGAPINVFGGESLLAGFTAGTPVPHAQLFPGSNGTAAPTQGVIGSLVGATPDDPADNTFTVTIDRDPGQFVRAYLTYELEGLGHWSGAVRSINGNVPQGGLVLQGEAGVWSTQVERIFPDWLQQGDNTITFSALDSFEGTYSIRNVAVLVELENGANLVDEINTNLPDSAETNPLLTVYDGDTATGWKPYPADQPINAQDPWVEFILNKPIQMDAVAFYISAPVTGEVQIDVLQNGVWNILTREQGDILQTGWNTSYMPTDIPISDRIIEGARVTFLGDYVSDAELRELMFFGSGVGPRYNPAAIKVSYPENGEFYGRGAYVRGFIRPMDNGSGTAQLFVAGLPIVHNNGEFATWITKDDANFGHQGDLEAWSVDINAVFPDGEVVTRTVSLDNQILDVAPVDGVLLGTHTQTVLATETTTQIVAHDEAELHVETGAITTDTNISVTPLADEYVPALDSGMVNVTKGPRRGYRFLPHGQRFTKEIPVKLKYNKSLIPPGYTEDDIKTFYFDEQAGRWRELTRVSIDTQSQIVTSQTDHFTDMINAVVTVPDSPQAESFNPTSIKDIKAADPGAGVTLIEPPSASNMGDARLSYPIEIPAGRNGLQPQLAVQYNSGGGNGWMGIGWDIPMQSVSIDTRWGVPRYDNGQLDGTRGPLETETYLLNGEQLAPVAHRGDLQVRTADKVFHTRVEGEFRKIVRHGDNPTNYWWEVTDKNGVRYLFGGPDATNSVSADAVLADPSTGNVFQWMLREVIDTNGNNMRFHYDVIEHNVAGAEPWRQIYLSRIRYTGTEGGADGAYEVVFNRASGRGDVIVDGRAGFKTVLDQRLASIDVNLTTEANPLIRRYVFDYTTGQFGKTLLSKVTQFGDDGVTEFNHHAFEYYDEVGTSTATTIAGFSAVPDITGAQTMPGTSLLGDQQSTAWGASVTQTVQGHFYRGIATGYSKQVSVGAKAGFDRANTVTRLSLMDINGDGLPDQVYQMSGDNSVYYRVNLGGPRREVSFGAADTVSGLTWSDVLGSENSSTATFGAQVFAFGSTTLADRSITRTQGEAFFSDVNGDGLPDLVRGGQVYFNRLTNGRPTYDTSSPTPLASGASAQTADLVTNPAELQAEMEAAYHLVDPVRRWVAPYSGTISITGEARLLSGPDADYQTADGVKVSIELGTADRVGRATELWSVNVPASDLVAKSITGLSGIPVTAGQPIYFRVNSINDGAFDAVDFNPTIAYTQVNGSSVDSLATDERGMPLYVFNADSDFAYSGRFMPWATPADGTASLTGDLVKSAATTDDVVLEVVQGGVVTHTLTIPSGQVGTIPVSLNLTTTAEELVDVHLRADTRVDWSSIRFAPKLTFLTVNGSPAPVDENGSPLFVFNPPVVAQAFPNTVDGQPYVPWVAPTTGTVRVTQSVSLVKGKIPSDLATDITLSVKRPATLPTALLAKQLVTVRGKTVTNGNFSVEIPVTAGDVLYFTADATANDTLTYVELPAPEFEYVGSNQQPAPLPQAIHLGVSPSEAFGGGFRRWSFGQYNGNDPLTIDQQWLRQPQSDTDEVMKHFVGMLPFLGEDAWRAEDPDAWIRGGQMSSTRLMLKYLDFENGDSFGGARGVVRYGGGKTTVVSVSAGGFGAGETNGSNWSDIDFFDFNGDRYPDIIGGGNVQLTLPNGALSGSHTGVGAFDRIRYSDSTNISVNLGSTGIRTITNALGFTKAQSSEMPAYNLSAGVNGARGEVDTRWDLVDVNGDGLPDYVSPGTNGLTVRLNLGHRFATAETWSGGNGTLRFEKTNLAGASINGSAPTGVTGWAYDFGGGISQTVSKAAAQQDLMDVNGDGLMDIVTKSVTNDDVTSTGTELSVYLNMGNRFEGPYTFNGSLAYPQRTNVTYSRNIGFHIDIPIPIPFTPYSIDLNPGGNYGESLGGYEVMLTDINGDGYVDHVYSDTAGTIKARINNRGRTNLLRTVYRPLGASFDLDYERSGNTPDQPQSRWVLSSVVLNDGHVGDGPDYQVSTFSYDAGYYDRAERDFYGYRTVTTEQRDSATMTAQNVDTVDLAALPLYRSIERVFLNDSFYTKGLLERETTRDGTGNTYLETINTYQVVDVAGTTPVVGLEDYTATRFPQLKRTDRRFYEGQATHQKSTYVEYLAYDAYGNLTELFDAADLGTADDVYARFGYTADDASCASRHIVGKADFIEVRNGLAGVDYLRKREAQFDCASGTGNLLAVTEHNDLQSATTNLAYYPDGTLESVTGPVDVNGQRHVTRYTYDTVVGTYPVTIEASFSAVSFYSSTAAYDYKYGKPVSVTDINNNTTTYYYDDFGRTDYILGPYDQGSSTPTIAFEYAAVQTIDPVNLPQLTEVPWAITRHVDKDAEGRLKASGTIDTVLFVDGIKRVLQTKKDARVPLAPGGNPGDNMIVSGCAVYDFAGRVAEQRYPTVEGKGSERVFKASCDTTVDPSRSFYDVLDRVVRSETPADPSKVPGGKYVTTTDYGFGNDRDGVLRFQTTVTDPNGNANVSLGVTESYTDVRNLITAVKQQNPSGGQTVLWTSYGYDAMGQIVFVRDAAATPNLTSVEYDKRGRRTAIVNPDTGRTEYRFDAANNLIVRITQKLKDQGAQITYGYSFNRLIGITYPNFPGNNVAYTYGAPGAANNRAGRIATVTHQAGTEERFYGLLGEMVKEINTIHTATTPNEPEVYTTEYAFDTFGRLQKLVYPDAEVLTYGYDSGGNLVSAQGVKSGYRYTYLRDIHYDRFERRTQVELGNNVVTGYTYDPYDRRLNNLTAGRGTLFQNLQYSYDPVGNIVGLANDVGVPPASSFGGPTQQAFTYDDLYRLTGASGSYQFAPDKTDRYQLSMAYDVIHNITRKTQRHEVVQPSGTAIEQQRTTYDWAYVYGGSQPHAPTRIGTQDGGIGPVVGRTFRYDANGNQESWDHDQNGTRRTLVWDDENRLQSLFDNGHEKAYVYDDAGQRVIKRGPQGETVYVNQWFTVRNGQAGTKHVFAGTERIVSKLMKQDGPGANPKGKTPFEKDLYYFHPDHLGSSAYVTDAKAKLYQHLAYFPFGETWVEEVSNTQRTPYWYTAKELDEETGLYYYGARYYDPRTSVWQSADPILGDYLNGQPNSGVYNSVNVNLYRYGALNPLRFNDPTGLYDKDVFKIEITNKVIAGNVDMALTQMGETPEFKAMTEKAKSMYGSVPIRMSGQRATSEWDDRENALYIGHQDWSYKADTGSLDARFAREYGADSRADDNLYYQFMDANEWEGVRLQRDIYHELYHGTEHGSIDGIKYELNKRGYERGAIEATNSFMSKYYGENPRDPWAHHEGRFGEPMHRQVYPEMRPASE